MATTLKRLLLFVLAVAAIGTIYYASTKPPAELAGQGRGKRAGSGGGEPVPVLAGATRSEDVPVYLEGVGIAKALNTVTLRPQVDGKIIKLAFREGQMVKRGDVIAEIDPTTYRAQLDQALAKKALSETQLANAKRDLERVQAVAKGVVAQKTVDTQQSQVAQLEAQIRADAAAVANAQAILDYTKVTAPFDGRTGIRMIDEGNIVRAGDAGIVVISQLQPIAILFSLPQQNLPQVTKAAGQGVLVAEALAADNKSVLDKGVLQVVDNLVDQTTGTVRMKAEFPNANMQLWPGQFVNVRLLVDTLKQVVVAPTPAIQRGPGGPFVYVVADDNRAAIRPITLGPQTEATSVVEKGLRPGERVVTTGFARLREGAEVSIGEALDPKTAPAAGTVAKGERRRGEGGKRGDGTGAGEAGKGDSPDGGKRQWKGKRERPAETSTNPLAPPASAAGAPAPQGRMQ